ncbi:MAG: hypothetical protein ROO76_09285 [Terriglobia bacterium]|jgi:hypothetical protein|nr:hypothetical protein [Terriglobia bacterium]
MSATYTDLWKQLSADERFQAAESFWSSDSIRAQQLSTMQLMAKRYNFRLKSLKALPAPRKAKMLIEYPSIPPEVLMAVVAAFHLSHRKELLVTFLDAAAIPHKDGLLSEEAEKNAPSADAIKTAVDDIKGKFPEHDVNVYLNTLYLQDPAYWKELKPYVSDPAS